MKTFVVVWERSMAVEAETEEQAREAVETHLMSLGVEAHNVRVDGTTNWRPDVVAAELLDATSA